MSTNMYLFFSMASSAGERIKSLEVMVVILFGLIILLIIALIFILLKYQKVLSKLTMINDYKNDLTHARERISYYFRGKDEERERISRELHDGVCSSLLGVRYVLEPYKDENEEFRNAVNWLQGIHNDLRNLSHELAPPELLQAQLEDALESMMARLCSKARKRFTFHKLLAVSLDDFPASLQQNIYRIVQELIGNIIKHSDARTVEMMVRTEKDVLEITIEDDSKNYEQIKGNGIGMENIQLRIRSIHAEFNISPTPEGVVYHISCDLNHKKQENETTPMSKL